MHFRTFRLQPPHALPIPGNASCSRRAWPPIRFVSLSAVLRISQFPSLLISRIRPNRVCVVMHRIPLLRTILSLPVALHPVSPRRSYFQLPGGKRRRQGILTLCARLLPSALGTDRRAVRTPGHRSAMSLPSLPTAHPLPTSARASRCRFHLSLSLGLAPRKGEKAVHRFAPHRTPIASPERNAPWKSARSW
jgi:hypothetical protein